MTEMTQNNCLQSEKLEKIVLDGQNPLKLALLIGVDAWGQYKVEASNWDKWPTQNVYALHEINGLVRLLGIKADLFAKSLLKGLYHHDQELTTILKWEGLERLVTIVDLTSWSGDHRELIIYLKTHREDFINILKED